MGLRKFLALAVFLTLPQFHAALAGDGIQAATAVWNDFVAALRRGDYPGAHAMFSAESRRAMPLAGFVREYGPLSAARELVLAKPESLSTRMEEDWAEISYSGMHPGTGRSFRIGVSLVRNGDSWGLVAARNEPAERLEALARGILRTVAAWRDAPDAEKRLAEFLAVASAINPATAQYRFEIAGAAPRALPLTRGLRAFHVDPWGMVREGDQPQSPPRLAEMPAPAAPPPLPAPLSRPPTNGLPELSEPPAPVLSTDLPGEMTEPPPPPNAFRLAEPEPVHLPDSIR